MTTRRLYRIPADNASSGGEWCPKYLFDMGSWAIVADNRTKTGTVDIWFEDAVKSHEWLTSQLGVQPIDQNGNLITVNIGGIVNVRIL